MADSSCYGWWLLFRLTAHIESAADFHDARVAGVDEVAHMPGFRLFADIAAHSTAAFRLSDADAELACYRGVIVVTTLVGATSLTGSRRAPQDATNVANLRRLLAHHVRLALGSDSYRQDTSAEAQQRRNRRLLHSRCSLALT